MVSFCAVINPSDVCDQVFDLIEAVSEGFNSYLLLCVSESAHVTIFCILLMNGRMTCDFTSFSTVFQSYQDDG